MVTHSTAYLFNNTFTGSEWDFDAALHHGRAKVIDGPLYRQLDTRLEMLVNLQELNLRTTRGMNIQYM